MSVSSLQTTFADQLFVSGGYKEDLKMFENREYTVNNIY